MRARLISVLLVAACSGSAPASAPLAVLHIGPHKSGSTYLQHWACGELRHNLSKADGVAILKVPGEHIMWTKTHANLGLALLAPDLREQKTWRWFLAKLPKVRARRLGAKILISTEVLSVISEERTRLLTSTLHNLDFKVTVVMVYRRLYEKLPSVHSELFMGPSALPYASFLEWLEHRDVHQSSRYNQCVRLRDRWAPLVSSVSIINLHALDNPTALLRVFVCDHLRAVNTCSCLQEDAAAEELHGTALESWLPGSKVNHNPRTTVALFDATAAVARSSPGGASPSVVRAASELLASSQAAAPIDTGLISRLNVRDSPRLFRCLNDTGRVKLLQLTEDEEASLFPEQSERDRRGLRTNFEVMVGRGVFCSVDSGVFGRRAGATAWGGAGDVTVQAGLLAAAVEARVRAALAP
ncbi:hypothetical protein T492DRAFT_902151 [Pavlovales sp. CCMP2436]|nr:hypothetical protein T492DRAFT_902151 [Pavlovales sp. CCMP2436]